jgi:S1-C subfamily serine protease
LTNGLKINDIIVSISGKDVKNISEFNSAVDELAEDTFISYTVYRNGAYQTVTPFDE